MRLIDFVFFEDIAVPFDIKDFPDWTDTNVSVRIGTSEGYYIYGSIFYGNDHDAYGILNDKNKTLAILIIKTREQSIERLKFQEIEKLWVDPSERGKALMITLINFVIRKQHTNLSSGEKLTSYGRKLFQKIIDKKSYEIEYIDMKSRQKINDEPKDLHIYPNRYQIVLCERVYESEDRRFGHGKGICEEMRRFFDESKLIQEWD